MKLAQCAIARMLDRLQRKNCVAHDEPFVMRRFRTVFGSTGPRLSLQRLGMASLDEGPHPKRGFGQTRYMVIHLGSSEGAIKIARQQHDEPWSKGWISFVQDLERRAVSARARASSRRSSGAQMLAPFRPDRPRSILRRPARLRWCLRPARLHWRHDVPMRRLKINCWALHSSHEPQYDDEDECDC